MKKEIINKKDKIKVFHVVFIFQFVLFFVLLSPFSAEAKKKQSSSISCKSVIFSDSTKVKRLYGKDVHRRVLPASTTKVMTAIIAIEKLSLNSYITVRSSATNVQPTKIDVEPGEQYKVSDLLYALLIQSANDASVVLAEAVAGSEQSFVSLMNKKARAIGAKNTKFANSNGLPSAKGTQYTTAYDMYLIFRYALKYPFFKHAIKYSYKTIVSSTGRTIRLKSHNKILFAKWKRKIYGKTGYTRAAQSCFVGTIEKGSSTLIVGVFGCTKRWDDIKRIVSTYGGISL